jgi:hypothetical protein
MIYYCDRCGKEFRLDEDITLNDLAAKRVLYVRDSYWHMPCSVIIRRENYVDVDENSTGKLRPDNSLK